MAVQRREQVEQQALFAAVKRGRGERPCNPPVTAGTQKRKREEPADLDLRPSHTFERIRLPTARHADTEVLKRPAAGEPITHMMVVPTETSLTLSPSQRQSEMKAYEASIQAVKKSERRREAAMRLLEQSTPNLAGTTLVASHDDAASPTFENGDKPAYIASRSRRTSEQVSLESRPLFALRALSPERPTWESIEPDTLGARWATHPQTGTLYLRTTGHGPAEQMAPVESLRTYSLYEENTTSCVPRNTSSNLSASLHAPLPVTPSTPSLRHERIYGVPLSSPSAHWYKDLGAQGCNPTSHRNTTRCEKTHQLYTRLTHGEANAQKRRDEQAALGARVKPVARTEGEMTAKMLADAERSEGRVRRQTRRAKGD